jgi:hypothetical protein
MMKEAVAVLMVIAGVAIAGSAATHDGESLAPVIARNAGNLPADVLEDIRLDAEMRLPIECPYPAAKPHRAPARRRAVKRMCPPRETAAPDVARKVSSDPTASARLAG